MGRLALGVLGIVVLTMFTASTAQQGCRDATKSLTTLRYPEHRDMRTTVALPPQKVVTRAPDEASVPVGGRDLAGEDRAGPLDALLSAFAELVDLSGAQIKLALLGAVFCAKEAGQPVDLDHLYRGIERELAKEGRSGELGAKERFKRHG